MNNRTWWSAWIIGTCLLGCSLDYAPAPKSASNGTTTTQDPDLCRDGTTVELGYIATAQSSFFKVADPIVSDGALMFHQQTQPQGGLSGLEIARAVPGGAISLLTNNTTRDILADAHGTQLLLLRGSPDGFNIIYRDENTETMLAVQTTHRTYGLNYAMVRPRQVRANAVVWQDSGTGAIRWWNDGELTTLMNDPNIAQQPVLDQDLNASQWAETDGLAAWLWRETDSEDSEVMVWQNQELRQLTNNTIDEFSPTLSNGQLFWTNADGIFVHNTVTNETRQLSAQKCRLTDAHQGQAVWICFEELGFEESLWHFDGEQTTLIRSGLDVAIPTAQIQDGRLVWVEYDDPEGWCETLQPGRVMFFDGNTTTMLDTINAGCWCCTMPSASSIALRLEFDGTLVAWNYAVSDTPADEQYTMGYATLG